MAATNYPEHRYNWIFISARPGFDSHKEVEHASRIRMGYGTRARRGPRANRRSVGDLYMGRLQYAQALAAYLRHELF